MTTYAACGPDGRALSAHADPADARQACRDAVQRHIRDASCDGCGPDGAHGYRVVELIHC